LKWFNQFVRVVSAESRLRKYYYIVLYWKKISQLRMYVKIKWAEEHIVVIMRAARPFF